MDTKIDYISFTLALNLSGVGHGDETYDAIENLLILHDLGRLAQDFGSLQWDIRGGRGHYGAGLYCEKRHISIWWGGIANHVLFEFAGVACQWLRDTLHMEALLEAIHYRLTRLDVAVDFPTTVRPPEFAEQRSNKRFKSGGHIFSEEGETVYVGSKGSERFARVYVYNEPHPRANVLRCEHQLRGHYAKEAGSQIIQEGLKMVTAKLGNSFGWTHELWQPDVMTVDKLRAKRHDTHGGGTLLWLEKAVKPALVSAHKEGLLDVAAWCDSVLVLITSTQSGGD